MTGRVWGFPTQTRAHLGAWKPESRSIYHTRAGNPNSGWVSPGRRFAPIRQRQSQSSLPHPAPAHPHPAAPTYRPTRPHPRAHTHAPTPTRPHPSPHTHAPTPNEKKNLKKNLTPLCFAPIVPTQRDEAMTPFVTIDNRRAEREQPSRANQQQQQFKTNGAYHVRIEHIFPPFNLSIHHYDFNRDCVNRRLRIHRRTEGAPLFTNPF